ncbi:tellurite resistance TerB family protein [Paralimibaculum aggregatum]|uniref:Tellurite resistance TerB family protein n=1 Tax=Paralimibaculum aggregatum TaxID=3036245 RepID=A0ABQ6LQL6_9RHOB|nr:tellurite resistance TerB family protein [Limibaculum sp. NKW23]GMG83234.1 tellurite resistance TerB family protein [Limibaculum sp. NKW23]
MNTDILSPQDALIAVMIAVSAADEKIVQSELAAITSIVGILPVFEGYDRDRIGHISSLVADLFEEEDGIDALIGLVEGALPDHLRETAYALACDVAAADGRIQQTEMRMLEIIRHDLRVGRLAAAAIERGARARHQKLEPVA